MKGLKNLTGWLVVNGFLDTIKFKELYEKFQQSADKFGTSLELKRNDEILVDIVPDLNIDKPDFVLFWDKDIKLARYLEKLGIRVFNSSKSIAICDDKSLTHLELMNKGIKMPRTIIAPMTYSNIGYTNYDFLDKVKDKLDFPIVVKEVFGSFGMQVYIANNKDDLENIVRDHGNSPLIFQEYIETSKGRDIRLQTVGNQVVAAMYRYNETGDFRANISNGGKMKGYNPTKEQKNLALKAANALGLDFAGVDLLFGKDDEPIICEVNSNAHFKNITEATGISVSDKIIEYIIEKI